MRIAVRNLHIECLPNQTPIQAINAALKNMLVGTTAVIECFTISSGEQLPADIVDDLIGMASASRIYFTWIEQTPWQVRLHVLYADDVDQEDETA